MRAIDADALQLAIVEEGQANKRKKYIIGDIWELTGAEIREVINSQPTIQPEPKRGQWIDRGERGDWEWQADGRGKHWHEWECNICHHYFDERTFFCPHCGADMRGEQYG